MTRETVLRICAALPGADLSDPFGPGTDVWKVGGKIFAAIGSERLGVSVKCPDEETAEMLKAAGAAVKAPYFHKSWVLVPFETADEAELAHRITVSYQVIRSGLPKKLQAQLAPVQ